MKSLWKFIIKCMAISSLFISLFTTSYAISLYELQSSNQYKLAYSTASKEFYINLNSIQSLRYNPPYYTLKYDVYLVTYNDATISSSSFISNYDYNYSFDSINKKQNLNNLSFEEAKPYILDAKRTNSGVTGSYKLLKLYDFDGNLQYDFNTLNDNDYIKMEFQFAKPSYRLAFYAFEKAYNIVF